MTEKALSNSQTSADDIAENLKRIREGVDRAMQAAHRTDTVRIMAVTKTVAPERINCAIDLGIDLLGENRVQEYLGKYEQYKPAEVHFIGRLQTNKVKYIIDKVTMIHSVDSLKLAQEIDKRAGEHGICMDVLAEVNIGGEETKGGADAKAVGELCESIVRLPNVRLRGLMAIPPAGCDEKLFSQMQEIFLDIREKMLHNIEYKDKSAFDTLSMGMSGDYEAAVKYGSTIIRVGSGLFGYREYKK